MKVFIGLAILSVVVLAKESGEKEKGLSALFAPVLFAPTVDSDKGVPEENLDYYDAVAAGLDDEPAKARTLSPIVRPSDFFVPQQPIVDPEFVPMIKVSQKDFETKKLSNFALFNAGNDGFEVQVEETKTTATGKPAAPVQIDAATNNDSAQVEEVETSTPEMEMPPVARRFVVEN